MSIKQNAIRIAAAKQGIKAAIIEKGVEVGDEHIEEYPSLIQQISGRPNLESVATSIILEESSNPHWTRGGNLQAVDDIIKTFGTYVIDPVHKLYARLDPANHNQFADGTPWSGNYGDAFRRFPRAYYLMEETDSGKWKLWLSKEKISNKYWDECWIGTYKANVANNIMHSRPNRAATGLMTMTNFWNAAQSKGTSYGLVNYFDHLYLNALHLLKFGTANSEETMGAGMQDAPAENASYYTASGLTAELGDGTGQVPYGNYHQNKLFGIEALAGQQWEFRPNIRFSQEVCFVYSGNIVSNTINTDSPNFVRVFPRLANLNNVFVKGMFLGEDFDLIPTSQGGSATTYWCDAAWSAANGHLLLVGGRSGIGASCGLSCSDSYDVFSTSIASYGARLAFRGEISDFELVDGAVIAAANQ